MTLPARWFACWVAGSAEPARDVQATTASAAAEAFTRRYALHEPGDPPITVHVREPHSHCHSFTVEAQRTVVFDVRRVAGDAGKVPPR